MSASDGTETIERFGSGSVARLLARLALYPGRRHAREELVELLWPDADPAVARNRLRQTLYALRALLEPPGPLPRPVIVADRAGIRAVDGALTCDAVELERAVREGRPADAVALYRGELLPGHYEDWVGDERLRLAALAERAERALAGSGGGVPAAPLPLQHASPGAPAAAERERSPLPLYLSRFFGRLDELAALGEATAAHRLVTVVGPGGCGKTRLAAEWCRAAAAAAAGAAVSTVGELRLFVPVVGAATRAALLEAICAALHVQATPDDALDRAVDALADRPALLVLDNFEQLVDEAGGVVAALLAGAPRLRVLATSRRPLGIDGERLLALAPLPLPAAGAPLGEAAASPSLGLFVDRARAVRADFHLGERNAVVLVALVRALDGLPLALELAASRVRSVAPFEMLEHLRPGPGARRGTGLALLARSGGTRSGHDARHASMLRTIEWSWQLLGPTQQRLLAELTVFEGGFYGAAAAAVCTATEDPMVVRLDELVAHSLLAVVHRGGRDDSGGVSGGVSGDDGGGGAPTRIGLDESIREFAAARLDDDDGRRARARHRRWLAEWGEALPATPPLAALRAELNNVGAALASALADDAPDEGVALMVALRRGLPDTALPATHLAALEAALARLADGALASRGHTLLARLRLGTGEVEAARRHAERGVAIARALHVAGRGGDGDRDPGDRGVSSGASDISRGINSADDADLDRLLARALQTAASVVWRTRRDAAAAEALLDEAEAPAVRGGDPGVRASALALRAFVANIAHRDLARAERLHGEALGLWEAAGDAISANNGRYNLAVCALRAGRFGSVLERLGAVVAEAERLHDWRLLSQAHNVAGEAHAGTRAWPAAARSYRQSLELAWNALAQPSFAYALWNLPVALAHRREPDAAARLAGAAERFWVSHVGALVASDRRELERMRRLVAAQIGADATDRRWREGAAMALPDVVALALSAADGPAVASANGSA